ncbi:hypothetical protein [Actinomadura sp. WMMA1423]|uniref:hypothetical protein n=1 Tax=Actinomadura sp. WMMA1423 TaxID=2591108 RepID=UPI001146D71B|nr:hypothetical protein [Actinomadura sp. WMMA1423]
MPHHRLRAGRAPGLSAALLLTVAFAVGCGPAEDKGAAPAKASAPASPSAAPTPASAIPNGVEKLKAAEILRRARKATASAKSLRMRGRIQEDGEKYRLDFRFAGKAKATGTFKMGAQSVQITRIGKDLYLKGDDAFWKSIGGKAAVQLLSGKQLKTTTKNPDFKDIDPVTDPSALLAEAVKSVGSWKKGVPGTVGGVPTVTLVGSSGEKVHVATRGEPYVLLLDGGDPADKIEYLDYDEPVDIPRPPAKTIVDADALN